MKRIAIDMPADLIAAASSPEAKDKPYNICLECPALKNDCDGPNCLAMLYPRWVEWINALAKSRRLTRAMIAEKANISLPTVNSALSGKAQDIKLFTAAAITRAVKGGSWGKYPCHFVSLLMNEDYAEAGIEESKEVALAKQQLAEEKDQSQRKIDFLKDQIAFKEKTILDSRSMMITKDRTIRTLGLLVGILGVVLIGLLIADSVIPDLGWFRY